MVGRTVHGEWDMKFEGRILRSKLSGSTNKEAVQVWFDEMYQLLYSSPDKDLVPWCALMDARDWGMAPLDAWEANNQLINWMSQHNCVLFSAVFSKKIQLFSAENGFDTQGIVEFFFDYGKAYQACLYKLAKTQNSRKT
ncbi:hypothetical protein L4C34_19960 [Vibrio profundum]|uniref:hypothetical protein n=1 Tax=Vibrio profundum TaxID=2910247 RepID=UPI003D0B5DC6